MEIRVDLRTAYPSMGQSCRRHDDLAAAPYGPWFNQNIACIFSTTAGMVKQVRATKRFQGQENSKMAGPDRVSVWAKRVFAWFCPKLRLDWCSANHRGSGRMLSAVYLEKGPLPFDLVNRTRGLNSEAAPRIDAGTISRYRQDGNAFGKTSFQRARPLAHIRSFWPHGPTREIGSTYRQTRESRRFSWAMHQLRSFGLLSMVHMLDGGVPQLRVR
jgi:hypothetical protein